MGRAFAGQDMPAIFRFPVESETSPLPLCSEAAPAPTVGTWHWCIKSNAVAWDEANYRLHGLTPDVGPPSYAAWIATLHPDDRPDVEHAVREALAGGSFEVRYRVAKPCGGWRVVIGKGVTIMDASGQPVHMAGTNIDAAALFAAIDKTLAYAEELGEILGADDADPDDSQLLVRKIRDTLRRASFKKIA
jgi:PAS domain-containing protein